MAEVQGQFDVVLSTPITLAPDLSTPEFTPCHFQIDGARVTIMPLTVKEAIPYPDGDYESAMLTEIRVWINSDIRLGRAAEEEAKLSADDERKFERVLVEATRRFVTLIRRMTNQWDLDTRHPVRAHTCTYSRGDVRVTPVWPLERGTKRIPEDRPGISLRPSDSYEELTRDIWGEVADELSQELSSPIHDELLFDAKIFRSQGRYDAAVLYAAIASELILEKACESLLRTRRGLNDKACRVILGRLRAEERLQLVPQLDPNSPIHWKDVRWLLELRNKIAHGKVKMVTGEQASKALGVAEQLKRHLAGV